MVDLEGDSGLQSDVLEDLVEARNYRRWLVDLALPHDVAPEVASLSSVSVAGLAVLGEDLSAGETTPQVQEVADLVIAEVAAYLTSRAAESMAPTVAALRSRPAEVVSLELGRLDDSLARALRQVEEQPELAPLVAALAALPLRT